MTLHLPHLNSELNAAAATQVASAPTRTPTGLYRKFFKRALDVTLIILAAPVVVPVIALLALAVAQDGGAPLYSQIRVGKDGRHFRLWKLRTMVKNADQQLDAYLAQNPAAHREWTATQKLKQDPRITRFGRILRKTSLDELPQLINVLAGSMSLVGPRPMMVEQQDFYNGSAYYDLRPGITGLWQISDRNDCDFVGRVAYDDAYARNLSLKTDLATLQQTVGVVLRATGH